MRGMSELQLEQPVMRGGRIDRDQVTVSLLGGCTAGVSGCSTPFDLPPQLGGRAALATLDTTARVVRVLAFESSEVLGILKDLAGELEARRANRGSGRTLQQRAPCSRTDGVRRARVPAGAPASTSSRAACCGERREGGRDSAAWSRRVHWVTMRHRAA